MNAFLGRRLVGALGSALLLMCIPNAAFADVLYAVDGGGMANFSNLYTVTPTVGNVTTTNLGEVTLNGTAVPLTAIAFDNGVLYGVTNQLANSVLVTINTTPTAPGVITATQVGTTSMGFAMTAMAYDAQNGNLYAYSKSGNTSNPTNFPGEALYTVSTTSGLPTLTGTSGLTNTAGDGLAVSSGGSIFFSPTKTPNELYTLDPTKGTNSTYSSLSNTTTQSGPIKGMAIDSAGTMYATINGTADELVTISLSSGGSTINDVGPLSTTSIVTGMAFGPDVAATPEPGSLLLVSLAAAGGLWQWRRRRGAARMPAIG